MQHRAIAKTWTLGLREDEQEFYVQEIHTNHLI